MVELTVKGDAGLQKDYHQFSKDEYFIYLMLQTQKKIRH